MGNLSGLTIGDTTFPVLAGGGGSDMIEGEYTIPEIYWCNNSGGLYTKIEFAAKNAHVWYQKTGKYIRAVIHFATYEGGANSYYGTSFRFKIEDLFGEGKLFPEGSNVVFSKFFGCCPDSTTAPSVTQQTFVEPFLSFGKITGTTDVFLMFTSNISNFPIFSANIRTAILIEAFVF